MKLAFARWLLCNEAAADGAAVALRRDVECQPALRTYRCEW